MKLGTLIKQNCGPIKQNTVEPQLYVPKFYDGLAESRRSPRRNNALKTSVIRRDFMPDPRYVTTHAKRATNHHNCNLVADAGFADEDFDGFLDTTTTFTEYVEADGNVAICGELSLEDAIDEALPRADATVTSCEDDDDSTDVVMPVPTTFADVLRHTDGIRNCICSRDNTEDLLSNVAQLERKVSLLGAKKVQKKLMDFLKIVWS